jgi:hypothetical protein
VALDPLERGPADLGPSLRKVRDARGLTLDDAARDTRIRREFLEAIEREEFERLLGEVHVRGCLRTYASYLRLSPDKVVDAYAASRPEPAPRTSVPIGAAPPDTVIGGGRRRDNHRLIGLAAATILVLAGAFGILSARTPAPAPADLPSEAPTLAASARPITVAVLAHAPVDVTIEADGAQPTPYHLEAGEGRSFEGDRSVTIRLSAGGTTEVSVNGDDEGTPGMPGKPWSETYSYGATASP